MRLTDTQVRTIKACAAECFGSNAKIWLFGSRVDDKALGGDIDLYVELTEPFTDAAWRALRFMAPSSKPSERSTSTSSPADRANR